MTSASPRPTSSAPADADEVSFGANMTTITFALSRAIGATLGVGDEIVVTRLDHDANVAPWLRVAEERGLTVRWVGIRADDCTPRPRGARAASSGRARASWPWAWPPTPWAPSTRCRASRAWPTPRAPGCGSTPCTPRRTWPSTSRPWAPTSWSARPTSSTARTSASCGAAARRWRTCRLIRVRPAGDGIPGRFETGTQAHELLAGLGGTIAYLEKVGITQGGAAGLPGPADGRRRSRLLAAMAASRRYETDLVRQLLERVSTIPGLRVRGITDPARAGRALPDHRVHARGPPPAGRGQLPGRARHPRLGRRLLRLGAHPCARPRRAGRHGPRRPRPLQQRRRDRAPRRVPSRSWWPDGPEVLGAALPPRRRGGLSRRGVPASPAVGRAASRAAASRGR